MEKEVVILGTGGHARVVGEILRASGRTVAGFVPLRGRPAQKPAPDLPLVTWKKAEAGGDRYVVIVGVGDNLQRQDVSKRAEAAGFQFTTAVHPSAVVGRGVELGPGTVVAAGAVLVLDIVVGRGTIVNTRASIDHDCRIGDWCHIAPGAVLAGSVTLGDGVLIGAGGVVINNVTVGCDSTVGAGAVVVRDLPESITAVGVPAGVLRDGEK